MNGVRDSIVVWWIKLPPEMPASYMGKGHVPATSLPIQIPADALGKR